MPLLLEGKKQQVELLRGMVGTAISAVVVDTRGVKVSSITRIRANARSENIKIRMVRNTLARLAIEGTPFECLKEALVGPSLLVLCEDELGAAAKLCKQVTSEIEEFKVRAVVLDGQLYDAGRLDFIANLPSRDQALGMLLGVLNAPVAQLLGTFKAVPEKWVRVLAAVKDTKEAA